jgi:hypothetical protein
LAISLENLGSSGPVLTVNLESFASGDSGTGGGGPVTLLESLHAFSDKVVKSKKRTVHTMF